MMLAMGESIGITRQRSFWLRCFLGVAFLYAMTSGALHAQVAVDKPLHLAHVEGFVTNSDGQPVTNAEVTLDQDGAVYYRTRTDDTGAFRFDKVYGHYWLRVARTQYAPAAREVGVGDLVETYLERKKLYVVVGPGECADACSSIYTSKREFEKAIKKKNRR